MQQMKQGPFLRAISGGAQLHELEYRVQLIKIVLWKMVLESNF
jgi:hypothetical protein